MHWLNNMCINNILPNVHAHGLLRTVARGMLWSIGHPLQCQCTKLLCAIQSHSLAEQLIFNCTDVSICRHTDHLLQDNERMKWHAVAPFLLDVLPLYHLDTPLSWLDKRSCMYYCIFTM